MTVRFSPEDLRLFALASHDRNPLHLNAEYARATPYGEPVVFGILGALACLGAIPEHAGQRLSELTADFQGPMFTGVEYQLRATEAGCVLLDGSRKLVSVQAAFEPGEEACVTWPEASAKLSEAAMPELIEGHQVRGTYSPNAEAMHEILTRFGASRFALPGAAMAWSSYFTGMEVPGARALFFKLSLSFPPAQESAGVPLTYRTEVRSLNSMNLLRVSVRLLIGETVVADGETRTLLRPAREAGSNRLTETLLPASANLQGKVAVVVGASRGLGAAISRALTSQGCRVHGIFQRSSGDALELERQLAPNFIPVPGDALDPDFWTRLREQLDHVDYLICNACPAPLPYVVEEASAGRINAYVTQGLTMTTLPMAAFLGTLSRAEGCLVMVSSIYVETNPKEWPHYVALKCAVEGLTRVAAKQNPKVRFLVVRPPKLDTDMTATPSVQVKCAPEEIAASIVLRLDGSLPAGQVVQI